MFVTDFRTRGRRGHSGHGTTLRNAVADILLGQHVDAGDWHNACLQTPDHGDLPLGYTRQHDDDPVAALQAVLAQDVCKAARLAGDIGEV